MLQTDAQQSGYRAGETLYMSIELAQKSWKLAFGVDPAGAVRVRSVSARDRAAVLREIDLARARLGVPSGCRVRSCHEAGRDGFWVHRWLSSVGVFNEVVDPSSLRVPRRARRAKTDRLDAESLLRHLIEGVILGRRHYRPVHVPSLAQESSRHLHRELEVLKKERTAHRNRVRSLLALVGSEVAGSGRFAQRVMVARQWDGTAMPEELRARLARELERLAQVTAQILELEKQRRQKIQESPKARRLYRLRAIGDNASWLLSQELFDWRTFANRRQLGACVGLTPTPYATGQSSWEQGISKAGNPRVRWLMIEIAWLWLRYQPQSELSLWYHRRYGPGSKRHRRVGIVALARKLLIALWRYTEQGIVPEGATLKA